MAETSSLDGSTRVAGHWSTSKGILIWVSNGNYDRDETTNSSVEARKRKLRGFRDKASLINPIRHWAESWIVRSISPLGELDEASPTRPMATWSGQFNSPLGELDGPCPLARWRVGLTSRWFVSKVVARSIDWGLGTSIDTLVETSTDYSIGKSIDAFGQALMHRLNVLTKLPRSALALL
ncbi:hypothetical protein F2Q69_00023148 [Brassica cretica]|uniref:Uncharacterized protein n=1 Tax=Brassica cretica TaxID=69181 RepID=A0A8S9QAT8_BRACR|nr:hypothetical protein F2Q69_00023148 [Brassica cretica]